MDYSWVPKGSLASLAPDCQIGKVASFQSGSVWPFREICSMVKFPNCDSQTDNELKTSGFCWITFDRLLHNFGTTFA